MRCPLELLILVLAQPVTAQVIHVDDTATGANDLVVFASSLPPGITLLSASQGLDRIPFGAGTLCLAGPLVRSVALSTSGGVEDFSVDLTQVPWTSIEVASTWTFQVQYRDSGASGLAVTNAGEALSCTFRP